VRYLLFCLHVRAAYSTAISAAQACLNKIATNHGYFICCMQCLIKQFLISSALHKLYKLQVL